MEKYKTKRKETIQFISIHEAHDLVEKGLGQFGDGTLIVRNSVWKKKKKGVALIYSYNHALKGFTRPFRAVVKWEI